MNGASLGSPWRRCRRSLAGALLIVVGACGRPSPLPPTLSSTPSWQRIELGDTSPPIAEARLENVGTQSPRLRGGSYRVIRQDFAAERSWTIALGQDPYLSLRPLRASYRACRYRYQATVSDLTTTADQTEVWRPTGTGDASARVEAFDLARFAGRRVRLALRADLEGDSCTAETRQHAPPALWGSPAIYHRRPLEASPPGTTDRPNIILLSMDALRADALGWNGRSPSLSPALDRLAGESSVWPQAFATFNVTNPSFASIFTGLYGKHHGVYDLKTPLPAHHPTLASLLRRAGYRTQALVAAHHLNHATSGLGRGFDTFTVAERQWAAEHATDRAIDWLQRQDQRFFLWLHLFDPHTPHRPPGRFALGQHPAQPYGLAAVADWTPFRAIGHQPFSRPRLAGHRHLYDGEVAYLDRQVDRLLGYLASRRLLERTLLVVLSDHGENMGEQGIHFRHAGLWDATTRVPLLIRWPGKRPTGHRRGGLAQTIDVLPTILGHLGLETPPVDGIDLSRTPVPERRFVYAEHQGGLGAMIRNAQFLYSRQRPSPVFAGGRFLFDQRRDPSQRRNLVASRPELAARADRLLDHWLADQRPPAAPAALDQEERARLRALGYIDP